MCMMRRATRTELHCNTTPRAKLTKRHCAGLDAAERSVHFDVHTPRAAEDTEKMTNSLRKPRVAEGLGVPSSPLARRGAGSFRECSALAPSPAQATWRGLAPAAARLVRSAFARLRLSTRVQPTFGSTRPGYILPTLRGPCSHNVINKEMKYSNYRTGSGFWTFWDII